jgi:hypothetical protein
LGYIAGNFGLRMAFVFAAGMLVAILVLAPVMARLPQARSSISSKKSKEFL